MVDKRDVRVGTPLANRELEALELLATGATQADVAHRMGLSVQTIKNVTSTAYHRLNVSGLIEAFAKLGWLRVPRRYR